MKGQALWERHPFLASALWNGLATVVIGLVLRPLFQTNDDVTMMLRAAGVATSGEPSPYLIHTHIWIGKLLAGLYSGWPAVPWYALGLAGTVWLGNVVLGGLLIRRLGALAGLASFTAYLALFGFELLVRLQFTMSATYVALAGLAWLASGSNTDKPRVVESVGACALFVLGALIRWHAALLAAALFVPVLLFRALRPTRTGRSSGWRPLLVGVLALALAQAAQLVNERALAGVAGWTEFVEFNQLRVRLVDDLALHDLTPRRARRALERAGWSPNDYALFVQWFFPDAQVFSTASLQAALEKVPPVHRRSLGVALADLREVLTSDLGLRALAVVVGALLLLRAPRRAWAEATLVLFTACLVFTLIYWFKKPAPPRVFGPVFAFVGLAPLLGLRREDLAGRSMRRWLSIAIGAGLAALTVTTWIDARAESTRNRGADTWFRASLEELQPDPERLYVSWGQGLPLEFLSPFGSLDPLRSLNLFVLGTGQRTPAARAWLRAFGAEDLPRAMARGEVAVILRRIHTPRLEQFATYAKEHLGADVRAKPLTGSNVYGVYVFQPAEN